MKLYFGSLQKSGQIETRLVDKFALNWDWDLGLIKLETPIAPVKKDDHFLINFICLPKAKVLNNEYEDALVSGFGDYKQGVPESSPDLLKTTMLISPYKECTEKGSSEAVVCATEAKHMTCFVSFLSLKYCFCENFLILRATPVPL